MVRHGHTKSRLGCDECKRRHIKCDESGDPCANCQTTGRPCKFSTPPPRVRRGTAGLGQGVGVGVGVDVDASAGTGASASTSAAAPPPPPTPVAILPAQQQQHLRNAAPVSTPTRPPAIHPSTISRQPHAGRSAPSLPEASGLINLTHLNLYDHASHAISAGFDAALNGKTLSHLLLEAARSTSYLIHEVLALSALHLAHTMASDANTRMRYLQHATALHTHARSLFEARARTAAADNPGDRINAQVFSFLVAAHTLCDPVAHLADDVGFDHFLESFVACIRLQHLVHPVANDKASQNPLRQTELGAYLEQVRARFALADGPSVDCECAPLRDMLTASDLSENTLGIYRKAVDALQTVFDAQGRAEVVTDGLAQPSLVWPTLVPVEYAALLVQRRPEALIVLAYYAVILHRQRAAWYVGGVGSPLISSITRYLGSYWARWMQWPNSAVDS